MFDRTRNVVRHVAMYHAEHNVLTAQFFSPVDFNSSLTIGIKHFRVMHLSFNYYKFSSENDSNVTTFILSFKPDDELERDPEQEPKLDDINLTFQSGGITFNTVMTGVKNSILLKLKSSAINLYYSCIKLGHCDKNPKEILENLASVAASYTNLIKDNQSIDGSVAIDHHIFFSMLTDKFTEESARLEQVRQLVRR